MRSPWCWWLAAFGAALALVAAPPRLAAASAPILVPGGTPGGTSGEGRVSRDAADGALSGVSSRRLRADDVAGTYSLFGSRTNDAGLCPRTLTLGRPVKVSPADSIELVRFPGESIVQDGKACAGGGLTVILTLALMDAPYIRRYQLGDAILRFNRTEGERLRLEWSDSVGIGMDSWACGSSVPRWDNATAMLFGDDRWLLFDMWSDGVQRDLIVEDGRPHVLIVNTELGLRDCALRGPKPPPTDSSTQGSGSDRSGDGGGLSAGPVVGVAIGAAVAAVAAAAAVALGYRRWAATRGRGGVGVGGGGGGTAKGGGHGGAPSVGGASSGTPAAEPPARSPRPSAAGGPPALGEAPPPPYPPPMLQQTAAAAGGGRPIPMATPGPPPQLPSGLFYTWETVTPGSSDAPTGGS